MTLPSEDRYATTKSGASLIDLAHLLGTGRRKAALSKNQHQRQNDLEQAASWRKNGHGVGMSEVRPLTFGQQHEEHDL